MVKTRLRAARTLLAGLGLCVATLALTSPFLVSAADLAPQAAYWTEVSIEPSPKRAGSFLCKAMVKDATSGEVVAAPAVLTPPGEEAETESTSQTGGATFTFRVKVDPTAQTATYAVGLRAGSEERALHKGTVRLKAAG